MPPGYIKLWRKTLESDIWDMPPLYFKIWSWLLLQVDWNTGTMTVTLDHIADRNQWVENNQPKVPHRKAISRILHWMEEQGMVNLELCGAGNRKYSKISVCNWDSYQSEKAELVTEMDPEKKQKRTTLKEVERSTKKKDKKETTRPQDQFLNEMAELWEPFNHNGSPPYSMFQRWRQQFPPEQFILDTMRGIYSSKTTLEDPVPYVSKALKNQHADWTRKQHQQQAKPPQDHIVESTGEPITDPDTRLRRIQLYAPRATTDPDQDRWYTLPDHVIQSGDLDPDTRTAILARNPDHVEA